MTNQCCFGTCSFGFFCCLFNRCYFDYHRRNYFLGSTKTQRNKKNILFLTLFIAKMKPQTFQFWGFNVFPMIGVHWHEMDCGWNCSFCFFFYFCYFFFLIFVLFFSCCYSVLFLYSISIRFSSSKLLQCEMRNNEWGTEDSCEYIHLIQTKQIERERRKRKKK